MEAPDLLESRSHKAALLPKKDSSRPLRGYLNPEPQQPGGPPDRGGGKVGKGGKGRRRRKKRRKRRRKGKKGKRRRRKKRKRKTSKNK